MSDENVGVSVIAIATVTVTLFVSIFLVFDWVSGSTHRQFMSNLNVVMECRKTVDASKADHICGPVPQWKGYNE
jgi:hypothetical protein